MDRDENNVRLFSWGFQSLVSCLWGTVILSPLTHNTGPWRVLEVFAVAVLITLCDVCVNKLSIQYKSLGKMYETLKYGIMFGLSPPNPETILDNIEKAESPVNFKEGMAGDEYDSSATTLTSPPPEKVVFELLASAIHALRTGCAEQDAVLAFTEFYSDSEVSLAIKSLAKWGNTMPTRRANRSDAAGFKEKRLRQVEDVFSVVKDSDFQGTLNVVVSYLIQDLDRVCFVPHSLTDTIFMRTEQATVKKKVEALERSVYEMLNNMHQMVGDVANAANRVTTTATNVISEVGKNNMSSSTTPLPSF
ncbi:unnamed protein product [Orchesella dallaii]|uniref:Uncharacterized protein n=1 Tax=Orchesella dallaii TaxID=48710 RepID=A0ABP1PHV7_9HEXA